MPKKQKTKTKLTLQEKFGRAPSLANRLLQVPKPDKRSTTGNITAGHRDAIHQADLLFLPTDKRFRYLLVVVDAFTKMVDMEALKTKNSGTVLSAMKKIWSRKYLSKPKMIQVDAGSEFKDAFSKYMSTHKVGIRVAETARHRQQGLVEATNGKISKGINYQMLVEELQTGKQNNKWIHLLPDLREWVNLGKEKNEKLAAVKFDSERKDEPRCMGNDCDILPPGTRVRVALDYPQTAVGNERLIGKFRVGDIRWSKQIMRVVMFFLRPNQPVLYRLSGKPNTVAYTRNQLQVVDGGKEQVPDTYEIEKLVERKKINNKIHYLVKWKHFKSSTNTWEPRGQLIKDVPDLVKSFEKKIKKR